MSIARKMQDTSKDRVNFIILNMARISGIDLKPNLQAPYSLSAIFGIGYTRAIKILKQVDVDPTMKMKDIPESDIAKIREIIEKNYKIEGELRQEIFRNIKRLKDIRAYRGTRHKVNLPTKGQRTRTNARTRKGKNMAVGGLKRVLTKT